MVVLIDTNVILDYLAKREPFFKSAEKIMRLCAKDKIQGCVAFHSISNIFFILRNVCDQKMRRELLKQVCIILTVVSASHERVYNAIERVEFVDFEDCLQDECALEANADYIITRNVQDFSTAKVAVITPDDFLKLTL